MPTLVSDMHAMAGLVDKSGLKNKSEDVLNSFHMVADAQDYVRTLRRPISSLICRRFSFFRLAIHISHASLAAGLALPDAEVETRRPRNHEPNHGAFLAVCGDAQESLKDSAAGQCLQRASKPMLRL